MTSLLTTVPRRDRLTEALTRTQQRDATAWTTLLSQAGFPAAAMAVRSEETADAVARHCIESHPGIRAYLAAHRPADDGMLTFAEDYAAVASALRALVVGAPQSSDASRAARARPPIHTLWDLGCAWGVQRVLFDDLPITYVGVDAASPVGFPHDAATHDAVTHEPHEHHDMHGMQTIPFFAAGTPRAHFHLGRLPACLPRALPRGTAFVSNMALGFGPPVGTPAVVAEALARFSVGFFRGPLPLASALLERFAFGAIVRRASASAPPVLCVSQSPLPFPQAIALPRETARRVVSGAR